MKRKVLIGATLWLLLISVSHVQLNIGWASFRRSITEIGKEDRQELVVGFLPVT